MSCLPCERDPRAPQALVSLRFDPQRVAELEAAGWRAYYERSWLRLFWLTAALAREQFRIPLPFALVGASYIARAAKVFAPLAHDDVPVRADLARFYRIVRRWSGLRFDPDEVAELELRYWDVHRRLSGRPDKTEFIEAMVALHSTTFGLAPDAARESAERRVAANTIVDTITARTSTDVPADWRRLEEQLVRCYRSIRLEQDRAAGLA